MNHEEIDALAKQITGGIRPDLQSFTMVESNKAAMPSFYDLYISVRLECRRYKGTCTGPGVYPVRRVRTSFFETTHFSVEVPWVAFSPLKHTIECPVCKNKLSFDTVPRGHDDKRRMNALWGSAIGVFSAIILCVSFFGAVTWLTFSLNELMHVKGGPFFVMNFLGSMLLSSSIPYLAVRLLHKFDLRKSRCFLTEGTECEGAFEDTVMMGHSEARYFHSLQSMGVEYPPLNRTA